MKWVRYILYAAVVVMALLVGARYWTIQASIERLDDAVLGQYLGPADAEQVIVEFMDYRCHACRVASASIEEFHRRHPDVKIVFRHVPVMGDISINEARIALAAGLNGKFIEMHSLLIARDEPVEDAEIDGLARIVGIAPEKLRADMMDIGVTGEIAISFTAAEALKVQTTPSFLINGVLYSTTMKIPTADDLYRVLTQGPKGEAL